LGRGRCRQGRPTRKDTVRLSKYGILVNMKEGPVYYSEPQKINDEQLDDVEVEELDKTKREVRASRDALQQELDELKGTGRSVQQTRIKLRLKLWVCDGFLEHGLCLTRLIILSKVYKRI